MYNNPKLDIVSYGILLGFDMKVTFDCYVLAVIDNILSFFYLFIYNPGSYGVLR